MKRKLEAELISIAHRILKLRNKSELAQLQQETLKLYEKISVLRFVEDNFNEVKPTIGYASAEKEVESIYETQENAEVDTLGENELEEVANDEITADESEVEQIENEENSSEVNDFAAEDNVEEVTLEEEDEMEAAISAEEEESVIEEEESLKGNFDMDEDVEEDASISEAAETDNDVHEEAVEEEDNEIEFAPPFEMSKEEKSTTVFPKQITLEDFLSEGHVEPIFVRAEQSYSNETTTTQTNEENEKIVTKVEVIETKATQFIIDHQEPRSISLNDSLSKTINIGLNDRIGFEKHLFGGSSEDLNRVLSQLSTYSNFSEANDFIEDLVKPDYNNWTGKEEYEARFMEIVEKKFS